MHHILKRPALMTLIALTLTGCSLLSPKPTKSPGGTMTTTASPKTSISNSVTTPAALAPTADEVTSLDALARTNLVRITTDRGVIDLELYPDDAPIHVANFLKLVQSGFYNGLTFHRVEPGFVIQGGDPKGDGTGGPGYTIKAEFNSRKHLLGTLAMARSSDPNSAGSQFYITLAPQPALDNQYTVFGGVVAGLNVISTIERHDIMTKVELIPRS